ncbi:hypothetical protein AM609_05220 [Actinomyces sp. oral taxon 414]|nr:hypothetical protein AM609_05220 [Actinomyces sp. oral taxon 414]
MTPASSAPGGAWPSRIEAGRPSRRPRPGRRPLEFSSGVVETIGRGRSKPSPGAVGAGSGRTRVGFWRPGRIVRADTPGGLGDFRMIPRFLWRYGRVRGGTILPGRHFSLRAGPRGLGREPDETHGAPGGRAPPGRGRPTVPSYPQDVHFPPVSRVVSAGFGERGGVSGCPAR